MIHGLLWVRAPLGISFKARESKKCPKQSCHHRYGACLLEEQKSTETAFKSDHGWADLVSSVWLETTVLYCILIPAYFSQEKEKRRNCICV